MKSLIIIVFLFTTVFASKFHIPIASFEASGGVTDMLLVDDKLYVSTDASCVDVFDFKTRRIIQKIKLDKIKDFTGEEIDDKIFSVDVIENKVLILAEGMQGYNRIYIYENGKKNLLISDGDSLSIIKAKFLDKNTILLALLSDEIISYDISKKKINYRVQASESKFSDFALNKKRTKIVVADESGDLQLLRTKDGSLIKSFTGENLDNVFQVDYKNGIIATAGKDRRMVIYNTNLNQTYYKTSLFFIYSVGLSPSGKLVAYSSDINNNITVFNTITKNRVGKFGSNKVTISKILFLNEKEFLVSNVGNVINLYKVR